MTPSIAVVSLLLWQAVSIEPSHVPADGVQYATLTVDAPSAIHFLANSSSGTSCEFITRRSGSFAKQGEVGKVSCKAALLLDAGQYRVRLESPKGGRGRVQLSARAYPEVNESPLRLVPGSQVTTILKRGYQASYWVTLTERAIPFIHVAGRNADDVRLWRNGEWLENINFRHTSFSPTSGEQISDWWLSSMVEPGDYLLAVYSDEVTPLVGGDESLTVEYGVRPPPPETALAFTLPVSGSIAVRGHPGSITAVLSLDAPPTADVHLEWYGWKGEPSIPDPTVCSINKGAHIPICVVTDLRKPENRVLMIRGPPGTRGVVEWANRREGLVEAKEAGDYYADPDRQIDFDVSGGRYLVGVHDLPTDADAAPLGCQLERIDPRTGDSRGLVARDVLRLEANQKLEREFNYDGKEVSIWLELRSGAKYRIAAEGGRKTTCELFRQEGDGALTRLSPTEAKGCNTAMALAPGLYQLLLSGGTPGVEKLVVREDSRRELAPAPNKAACLFPEVQLEQGRYRLRLSRTGDITLRGLAIHPLPLTGERPVHLTLDPGVTRSVSLGEAAMTVRSFLGGKFTCRKSSGLLPVRDGECAVPGGKGTLTLENPGTSPLKLTVGHLTPVAPAPPPESFVPSPSPIQPIALDVPAFFDFEKEQSHTVLFEVKDAGLYEAVTQGLLTTRCALRAPAITGVAEDVQHQGSGRNCLVRSFLEKGRYLFTVSAEGASRGRAALKVSRRTTRAAFDIDEGESFLRVPAGELIRQRLTVKSAGVYRLETTSPGIELQCRLEDTQGWPLNEPPFRCTGEWTLKAGTYFWMQQPIGVEALRRTQFGKVQTEQFLEGDGAHRVGFFTWYPVKLGKNGENRFLFELEGESEVLVALTNSMQGRIERLEEGKPPSAVEIIPPRQDASSRNEESEPGIQADVTSSDGDEGGRSDDTSEPQEVRERSVRAVRPSEPSGTKVKLPPGRYQLVAVHSRADVGVQYQLYLGSSTLIPGMSRQLEIRAEGPMEVPVSVPRDGTLRIRTSGAAQVRCRLFDERGQLAAEGNDQGNEWNCSLAEPMTRGKYRLVIENLAQVVGATRLSLALSPSDERTAPRSGDKLELAQSVVTVALPQAAEDAVQELSFRTEGQVPFSCALEGPTGGVIHRWASGKERTLLVRPGQSRYRVRLWTLSGSATVSVTTRTRPISRGSKGQLSPDRALLVEVPRAGRYRTSAGVHCLPGAAQGLLRECGPEVSLEAGPVLFSVKGAKASPLPLAELQVAASEAPVAMKLSSDPFLQVVTARAPSVFLLSAQVEHGERAAPSCAVGDADAVHEQRASVCHAASGVATQALERLWTASNSSIEAQLTHRAVPLPSKAHDMGAGRQQLRFPGGVGLYALPAGVRSRLELTLARDGWAVLLDDRGRAVELCAPREELRQCLLDGSGGRLLLVTSEAQADVTLVRLEGEPQSVVLTSLYERSLREAGTLRLTIPATARERQVRVAGAAGCTLSHESGERVSECSGTIPASRSATLSVGHGAGPVRALVYDAGRELEARLGVSPARQPVPELLPATAIPLQGDRIERALALKQSAVVHLRAESGVCALLRGEEPVAVEGMGQGCDWIQKLAAGSYRVVVRSFGGQSLDGRMQWIAEPVLDVGEGVGAETWLSPGGARVFRFQLRGKARVGLGIQAKSEELECSIYDERSRLVGDGCQQFVELEKGEHMLVVKRPAGLDTVPVSLRPVLLGLSGNRAEVPEEYLKEFFERIGEAP